MLSWMLAAAAVLLVTGGIAIWKMNDVEQATYRVASVDGPIEIREYPEQIVAEVARAGSRTEAAGRGFRPLASYIFARERTGDPIAMTAPVTQRPHVDGRNADSGQNWTVRFVMPAKHALSSLPAPAGGDVRLVSLPPARRAVVRFSGTASDANVAEAEARLRAWVAAHGLKSTGLPTYAYYNAPFTPPPLRRNEVWLDIDLASAPGGA